MEVHINMKRKDQSLTLYDFFRATVIFVFVMTIFYYFMMMVNAGIFDRIFRLMDDLHGKYQEYIRLNSKLICDHVVILITLVTLIL